MSKEEFGELSLAEQGMILMKAGKHLTQIQKDDFLLNLYSVYDFFVEVYYSTQNNNIVKIELMNDLSRIDQYIDEHEKLSSQ